MIVFQSLKVFNYDTIYRFTAVEKRKLILETTIKNDLFLKL